MEEFVENPISKASPRSRAFLSVSSDPPRSTLLYTLLYPAMYPPLPCYVSSSTNSIFPKKAEAIQRKLRNSVGGSCDVSS
jgi:hypothetical protein